jgi:hypothetical protein
LSHPGPSPLTEKDNNSNISINHSLDLDLCMKNVDFHISTTTEIVLAKIVSIDLSVSKIAATAYATSGFLV